MLELLIAGNIVRINKTTSGPFPAFAVSQAHTKGRVLDIQGYPELYLNMSQRDGKFIPIANRTIRLDPLEPISTLRAGSFPLAHLDHRKPDNDNLNWVDFRMDSFIETLPWDGTLNIGDINFIFQPTKNSITLLPPKTTLDTWIVSGEGVYPFENSVPKVLSSLSIQFYKMASLVISNPEFYHYVRLKAIYSSKAIEVRGVSLV